VGEREGGDSKCGGERSRCRRERERERERGGGGENKIIGYRSMHTLRNVCVP
jgi:hypothetical protein